jgi:hypothetical protein
MIRIKRITMLEMYSGSTAPNHNTSGKKFLNICRRLKKFFPLFPINTWRDKDTVI